MVLQHEEPFDLAILDGVTGISTSNTICQLKNIDANEREIAYASWRIPAAPSNSGDKPILSTTKAPVEMLWS